MTAPCRTTISRSSLDQVGGRLTQAELHPHVKHLAILPKGHHVSRLLIKHFHEKVQHQGR
ncbi:hypothetical protein QTP70_016054, partial [Hemibagrus guttatus]